MVKIFACGISQYRGTSNLQACANDAVEFCETFFRNFIIAEDDICIASEDGYITQTEYIRKLKYFCDNAQNDDTLLIFHSGHGGIDDNNDTYLLLSDSFNEDTVVYADKIIELLINSQARTKVLILDCCYSDVGNQYIELYSWDKAIEKIFGSGIVVISSCHKTEQSTGGDENSVFTQFVCNALADKKSRREGFLYLNDFETSVRRYADVYNQSHPDKVQTPAIRTKMLGTVAFQARHYVPRKTVPVYNIEYPEYDLVKMKADVKEGKNKANRKFVTLCVLLKQSYNFNDLMEDLLNRISKLDIPINSWKKNLVMGHPIEILNITIYNDQIDYESNTFIYHVVWTKYLDTNWHHKRLIFQASYGYYSVQKNQYYDYSRNLRMKNVFTDEELIAFWKVHVGQLAEIIGQFDTYYHSYKNGDKTVNELVAFAKQAYQKLARLCDECDNACFPMPMSEYKFLHDKGIETITNARSIIQICALHTEKDSVKHLTDVLDLEWGKYNVSFKKWSDELTKM